MTTEEVLRLPAAVDIVTAGRALGIGRTKAHDLARTGRFPVPLLRVGSTYRVRRTDLLALLGIRDRQEPQPRRLHALGSDGGGPGAA